MKIYKNKLLLSASFFLLSLSVFVGLGSGTAFAATKTWDGGGSDKNFSTAANWDGNSAPVSGDSLVLPRDVIFTGCTTSSTVTLNNDFDAANVTVAGIAASGASPANCSATLVISGNEIKTSGDVAGNAAGSSWPKLDLQVPLTVTSAIEVSNVASTSSLSIGTNNVTVKAVSFDGGISGSGDIIIGGFPSGGSGGGCSATVDPAPFAGDSSGFSGDISVTAYGSLTVSPQQNDIARYAASIASGNYLSFGLNNGQNMDFGKDFTLSGGSFSAYQSGSANCEQPATSKKVTITGDVTLTAATNFYLSYADVHFAGAVTGKQYIKVSDGQSGSVTFADGSSLESAVKKYKIDSIDDCSDLWGANTANSHVTVNVDCTKSDYYKFDDSEYPLEIRGIIGGTGKIGHIKVLSGGAVAPGLSPGVLTVASIEWEEGGIYEFEIGKSAADQIKANGTVKLGNGTLSVLLYDGAKPAAGKSYVIIANDGKDAVNGTFKGLPEGATFESDGYVYGVSYKGGDGNDVVLTVQSVPAAPDTGFEMLTNNPVLTLAMTTGAAAMILSIARRRAKLFNRA